MKKLLFLIIAVGAGFAYFGKGMPIGDDHTRMIGPSLPNLGFIRELPFIKSSPVLSAAVTAVLPAAPAYPQYGGAGAVQARQAPAMPQINSANGTFSVPPAGAASAAPKTGIAAAQDQLSAVAKALK